MLIIDRVLPTESPASDVDGELRLNFSWRQKTRARVVVARGRLAGASVGIDLPRGTVLRDGDRVAAASGERFHVAAAIEQLLEVRADSALQLARLAYHLGNRHVPLQLGIDAGGAPNEYPGWIRIEIDHVLEQMVIGLGGRAAIVSAPFDPERGAYGHGEHRHAVDAPALDGLHCDDRHAPRIHDFTDKPT